MPGIFSDLTVRDNLSVALQRSTSARALARETDRLLVYLTSTNTNRFGQAIFLMAYSNGWRSAWRLRPNPRLLLLDEPTAGMSVEETARTGELVQRLNADGTTDHRDRA